MTIYASIQNRGVLTLPSDVRKRHHLDEPGAQVEIVETEDGIMLKPMLPVDANQAWFWKSEWQEGESQASTERDARLGKTYENVDDFLGDL